MTTSIVQADYSNPQHQQDIPLLLNNYANDPMGGGKPLAPEVTKNLVSALAALPYAFSIITYVDGIAAGLVNCFESFSTFNCKPLVNIHDVIVLEPFRGMGLSIKMLEKVEEIAKAKGCCKMTLEVLSNNEVAKAAYQKFGFANYELDSSAGHALFWQKHITLNG